MFLCIIHKSLKSTSGHSFLPGLLNEDAIDLSQSTAKESLMTVIIKFYKLQILVPNFND